MPPTPHMSIISTVEGSLCFNHSCPTGQKSSIFRIIQRLGQLLNSKKAKSDGFYQQVTTISKFEKPKNLIRENYPLRGTSRQKPYKWNNSKVHS